MIAIQVPLVEHATQLPKVPGKLFIGPPPVDLSASRTSDQLVRQWLKTQTGHTVVCPLTREAPSSPVKLKGRVSLMNTYRELEQKREIKLNPFPIADNQAPSISSLRAYAHDLVSSLQSGRNVFLHGQGLHDRAPLIVGAILRELYRASGSNTSTYIRNLLGNNEPLSSAMESRVLDDAYPSSVQYGDKTALRRIFRQVAHSGLREDAGRSVSEWKDLRITTVFVLGEKGPIANFLRRQDFEVVVFPISEADVLQPEQEVRFFLELERFQRKGEGELLLLDCKARSVSLYLLALLFGKIVVKTPESIIKSIKKAFPGTEFNPTQTNRLLDYKKRGSLPEKVKILPVPKTPFHLSWTEIKPLSCEPGEGNLSLACISSDFSEMGNVIRAKGVSQVLLICDEKEAEGEGVDLKELDNRLNRAGIQITYCGMSAGDEPPQQETFEEGIDALIELSIGSSKTLILTTQDKRRAGIVIAGSIGRSLAIGSQEALSKLGFDPHLSPMQLEFLSKYLGVYKFSTTSGSLQPQMMPPK